MQKLQLKSMDGNGFTLVEKGESFFPRRMIIERTGLAYGMKMVSRIIYRDTQKARNNSEFKYGFTKF